MPMTPDTHTIQETFIEVGPGGHTLYVHEWGNPESDTVIFNVHGGPGGASKDRHKQVFDPLKHRVIFFDQRGCGKSLPYGSLAHNTTDNLIADITKIADHLNIKQFYLTGNSWGSGLSLAYAIKHPDRVKGLIISGIFTGSKPEIAWLDQGMFRIFYPDIWEQYLQDTPTRHRDKPTAYHFANILGDNTRKAKQSGYIYENLEGSIVKLDDRFMPSEYETYDPAGIRIEVHYMANGCFMPNNYILDNAHKLTMPIWIVQGRYDMVCPPKTAHSLAAAAPHAELIWTTSGHLTERESWNIIRLFLANLT